MRFRNWQMCQPMFLLTLALATSLLFCDTRGLPRNVQRAADKQFLEALLNTIRTLQQSHQSQMPMLRDDGATSAGGSGTEISAPSASLLGNAKHDNNGPSAQHFARTQSASSSAGPSTSAPPASFDEVRRRMNSGSNGQSAQTGGASVSQIVLAQPAAIIPLSAATGGQTPYLFPYTGVSQQQQQQQQLPTSRPYQSNAIQPVYWCDTCSSGCCCGTQCCDTSVCLSSAQGTATSTNAAAGTSVGNSPSTSLPASFVVKDVPALSFAPVPQQLIIPSTATQSQQPSSTAFAQQGGSTATTAATLANGAYVCSTCPSLCCCGPVCCDSAYCGLPPGLNVQTGGVASASSGSKPASVTATSATDSVPSAQTATITPPITTVIPTSSALPATATAQVSLPLPVGVPSTVCTTGCLCSWGCCPSFYCRMYHRFGLPQLQWSKDSAPPSWLTTVEPSTAYSAPQQALSNYLPSGSISSLNQQALSPPLQPQPAWLSPSAALSSMPNPYYNNAFANLVNILYGTRAGSMLQSSYPPQLLQPTFGAASPSFLPTQGSWLPPSNLPAFQQPPAPTFLPDTGGDTWSAFAPFQGLPSQSLKAAPALAQQASQPSFASPSMYAKPDIAPFLPFNAGSTNQQEPWSQFPPNSAMSQQSLQPLLANLYPQNYQPFTNFPGQTPALQTPIVLSYLGQQPGEILGGPNSNINLLSVLSSGAGSLPAFGPQGFNAPQGYAGGPGNNFFGSPMGFGGLPFGSFGGGTFGPPQQGSMPGPGQFGPGFAGGGNRIGLYGGGFPFLSGASKDRRKTASTHDKSSRLRLRRKRNYITAANTASNNLNGQIGNEAAMELGKVRRQPGQTYLDPEHRAPLFLTYGILSNSLGGYGGLSQNCPPICKCGCCLTKCCLCPGDVPLLPDIGAALQAAQGTDPQANPVGCGIGCNCGCCGSKCCNCLYTPYGTLLPAYGPSTHCAGCMGGHKNDFSDHWGPIRGQSAFDRFGPSDMPWGNVPFGHFHHAPGTAGHIPLSQRFRGFDSFNDRPANDDGYGEPLNSGSQNDYSAINPFSHINRPFRVNEFTGARYPFNSNGKVAESTPANFMQSLDLAKLVRSGPVGENSRVSSLNVSNNLPPSITEFGKITAQPSNKTYPTDFSKLLPAAPERPTSFGTFTNNRFEPVPSTVPNELAKARGGLSVAPYLANPLATTPITLTQFNGRWLMSIG